MNNLSKRILPVAILAALAVSVSAIAAKPPKPNPPPSAGQLTIAATPNPVTFGSAVTLSGQLKGNGNAAQPVQVQAKPYPYIGAFATIATVATDANGAYRFSTVPQVGTRYRTVTTASGGETSAEVAVGVRYSIRLSLSDSTPRRGALVRFSGLVRPAHDGRLAYIQRRSSTGSYRTVARTRLRDAGSAESRYSRRIRIYRSGVYRVTVLGDGDHVSAATRGRSIRTH